MSLKPWREIARPHRDVLEDTFQQSEFAADISQVAAGIAPEEYQSPVHFYQRTFITEGMRLLLRSVARRLAGQGGDPVIQLQTSFGGGKTHTMLAVYHLASRKVFTADLQGVPPILDDAGITELPTAQIAVLDGIKLALSEGTRHGDITVNTIWGEMAWQLLGSEGYQMVAASDRDGTSPGKEILAQLLAKAAPCVILIDELQKYFSQFADGRQYNAGTFESNIAFVQALTEALKTVPTAVLLASLPESKAEIGSTQGEKTLLALEKHFGRVESVWKPVAATEAFEIVRRRLFEYAGSQAEIEGISRQFHDFYRQHSDKFPLETQSNDYFERLCQSYPIHPEIFDRLYEDWSTLDKFQRTRGVLQYMAVVIHELWVSNNRDALIMPGSLPLGNSEVRTKSTHYLPPGWEPVIEKEVDGLHAKPTNLDSRNPLFGSVQAATRTMRTIFLGSAPAAANQTVKGIKLERILLGSAQPEQTLGHFSDALKRLHDQLQYLYENEDRYWLDTKPNLRREMESRKQTINDKEQLSPLLKKSVEGIFAVSSIFKNRHVFTSSGDVPDSWDIRLVVLPPEVGYTRTDTSAVYGAAEEILTKRGEQARLKQNRLIFFAADADVVGRLKEAGRTYLAWRSIVQDIKDEKLNLDLLQAKLAQRNCDTAKDTFKQTVRQTYKWLLCPMRNVKGSIPSRDVKWEAVSVLTTSKNLTEEIEKKLAEEEWVIRQWSPVHLRNLLNAWYFKDGKVEVGIKKVWEDCGANLFLPRLLNDDVFIQAASAGLNSKDFFGYAAGKEQKDGKDHYLGFGFDERVMVLIDDNALLIEREAAVAYKESLKPPPKPEPDSRIDDGTGGTDGTGGGDGTGPQPPIDPTPPPPPPPPPTKVKKRFYGTIALDPNTAKMGFADVVDEVLQQFVSRNDVRVNISFEIEATSTAGEGFDENLQRSVRENCNMLKFDSVGFEED